MGKLYVVATPIGNLADISLRAVETLKTVDLIAAEDTRTSAVLLKKYDITTPLTSYHQHSKVLKIEKIISFLTSGQSLALITDAGTPGISDPGGLIVAEARKRGIEVVPIPGASALTALLSTAGLDASRFIFFGFLPKKKGRQKALQGLKEASFQLRCPFIIFESPERFLRLLDEIETYFGDQIRLTVGRELTKVYEEIWQGGVREAKEHFRSPRGELVVIVG